MYTTHGDHIPGTRLGMDNPPLRPARCGGTESCPDCMLEAAAITRLDYYREDKYDDGTLSKVFASLCKAGVSGASAVEAIKVMRNDGILFRERKQKK